MSKIRVQILAFSFLVASFNAHAMKKVEGTEKFNDVTLTKTLELDDFDQIKLKAVGHALRSKKIAFMNFEVYVGEVLVPTDMTWNQKMSEYVSASPAGIQMTFLRDVPADKMITAFDDSLKENNVNLKSEPIEAFLAAVKKVGDLKENDVFLIVRKKAEKADQVLVMIVGRTKEVISGPSGWSDDILKIWGGKPADAGFEKFQKELFK